MNESEDRFFKKFNINKYILDNLNSNNCYLYCGDMYYDIEKLTSEEKYGGTVIKSLTQLKFSFRSSELLLSIQKSQDNSTTNSVAGKEIRKYRDFILHRRLSKIRKELLEKEISDGEQKIIDELPQDFMRECSIGSILD